jgi:hypothetical protein
MNAVAAVVWAKQHEMLATPRRDLTPESAAERLRCADQATMEKPETGPSIVRELAYSQKGEA